MSSTSFFVTLLALVTAGGIAAYEIPNGSFEELDAAGIPAQWDFTRSNNDAVEMRIAGDNPSDASRCLYIANPVPLTPQVYGALSTTVRLQPDQRYRLRCDLRGTPCAGLSIALGPNWNLRFPLQPASEKWQTVEFPFSVQAGDLDAEGNSPLVIISESRTDGVWLDRLEIVPEFPEASSLPPDTPPFRLDWAQAPDSRIAAGTVTVTGLDANEGRLTARLCDADGKERFQLLRAIAAPEAATGYSARFWFPLEALPVGAYELAFFAGARELGSFRAEKIDLLAYENERLDDLQQQAQALRQLAGEKLHSLYIAMPLAVLDHGLQLLRQLRDAIAQPEDRVYYLERCALAVDGLAAIHDRVAALLQLPELPPTHRYVSSPAVLENGRPYARMRSSDGGESLAPVLFTGYGHFEDVVKDIPLLRELGANFIQIEVGPAYVLPGPELDAFDGSYLERYVLTALRRAWEHDIKVNLLLSPHYTPPWWLAQHPELRSNSGFLNYEVNHPESRRMLQAYLDRVLPAVAASPYREALQGITITNEPAYIGFDPDKAFAREHFRRYLAENFGTPEEFSEQTGLAVASWQELFDRHRANPVFRYEFNRCKQQAFADFHAWFADAVRARFPGVPLMAKIMIGPALDPATLDHGVDPEQIGAASDYQGNDNTMFPNSRDSRFCVDWESTAFGHEFQVSTGRAGVANTENHVIPDNVRTPMRPGHVYTATFQQYITGAVALATWVWVDITPVNRAAVSRDLNYNIAMRPGAIEEQARALLDGNRLADEIAAFTAAVPKAVLLYSPVSMTLDGTPAFASLREWYRESAFSGYRVGFVTESQLQNGIDPAIKLIVVPDSTHVSRAAPAALREFAAAGGILAGNPEALRRDQYGREIPEAERVVIAPLAPAELAASLRRTLGELPVTVATPEELFCRSVPYGRGQLLNLVNYQQKTVPVRLETHGTGTLWNRLTEQIQPLEFELAPLQPLLLEWRPEL